jgi:hypothetical protein
MNCGPDAFTQPYLPYTKLPEPEGEICYINNIKCCCPKPLICESPNNDTPCNECCNLQYKNSKGAVKLNHTTVFNTAYNTTYKKGNNNNPINQRGRWNTSSSNHKLFRVISRGFAYGSANDMSKTSTWNDAIAVKQSGNLFSNTTHHMTKREILSYLSRNGTGNYCLR